MSSSDRVETVRQLCRYIETHAEEPLGLADLGRRVGLSPAHLQRVFKRITGVTPRQFVESCRMGRLKSRLRGQQPVATATYAAGFGSSSRVYEKTNGRLGMTPSAYRDGGRFARIGYSIADCPLGRLLLAATERGVCAVILGDDDAELEEWLTDEFPAAEISRDAKYLGPWLEEVLVHVAGEQPHLDLPLDVQATAFQMKVWQKLCEIPYGTTKTYSQIAEELGQPRSARAVARACATNPASIVIPCHRVVRADGDLGGYRWGLQRKRKLLDREKS